MGVTGAAIATTLGLGLGVFYQLDRLLRRSGRLQVHLPHFLPQREVMAGLWRVASTGTVQTLLETASWLG
jgi:Na+-driven multidrug efflux pump